MPLTTAVVALCCFAAGGALSWALFAARARRLAPHPTAGGAADGAAIPFGASVDELAGAVDGALRDAGGAGLAAIYAGREGSDELEAVWRAPSADDAEVPARIPAAVAARPGPSAEPPFALAGDPRAEPREGARVAVAAWHGPFGWRGVAVGRPGAAGDGLEQLERAIGTAGERLGAHCELAERSRRAEAAERRAAAAREAASAPPPPEAPSRLRRAEARLAEALQAPRREGDLVRATVSLLAEGLGTDRCYAVEIEGFRTRPIAVERRSEAAASAEGLDFGEGFLRAVRARTGQTIEAIALDAAGSAELVPEGARARLGPVSRMMLPVLEKGRIALVYVAEWIDLARRWSEEDVAFAERVVARSAVARERILQYEAIAGQAAHAREEQERVEEAHEQLQAIVAALPDAVVGIDADGRVTFVNRAAARLFGAAEFEIIGRWVAELAVEHGGDVEAWERALAAETTERYATTLARGGRRAVELTVVPGVASSVCSRLIALGERNGAVPGA